MSTETRITCDICRTETASSPEGWGSLNVGTKREDVGPRCLQRLHDTGGYSPKPGEAPMGRGSVAPFPSTVGHARA